MRIFIQMLSDLLTISGVFDGTSGCQKIQKGIFVTIPASPHESCPSG